ncbi:uncharacterized protein DNG_05138 [Cephalotrichum gorgonifer]|uniref:JmjC domain-containing protein n=1 Tax=Cephalotrichum gorgonifer TaxID=2041049 RepID=A0AAE8MXX1_9PEZI|nr:uncharacterized protein DNG_05138 [Cephalotrichum gorgonifer]
MSLGAVDFPTPPVDDDPAVKLDEDFLVLSHDQRRQVNLFRDKIYDCENDEEKYKLCAQTRDELLARHTGLEFLVAAYDRVIFVECVKYKQWRNRDSTTTELTRLKDSEAAQWDQFIAVARNGSDTRLRCLVALKTVSRYWGRDMVQHYEWASRGAKYCDVLCSAARQVRDPREGITKLNWLMLQRSKLRRRLSLRNSVNPIDQIDLINLRAWSSKDPFINSKHPEHAPIPYKPMFAKDLPNGFGFDKFGLMVQKEHAVPSPKSSGTDTIDQSTLIEMDATIMNPPAPDSTGAVDFQGPVTQTETCQADSVPDDSFFIEFVETILTEAENDAANETITQDTAPAIEKEPPSDTATNDASDVNGASDDHEGRSFRSDKSTGRTLRARTQTSYREPSGSGTAKPRQGRLVSVNVPKIPQRCCPAKVPSTLLSALDNPSLFHPEVAEQFSPLLSELCRPHLQLFAARTSAIASQRDTPVGSPGTLSRMPRSGAHPPIRRRASLPDIMSKRPRLDEPSSLPSTNSIRSNTAVGRPMHDRMADDAFRRQVLAELQETIQATPSQGTHGAETNELVCKLLEKAEQPNTDPSRGVVEALFCTGDEAASLVESESPYDAPIITEGQQQFRWSNGGRPIVQLFRRMGALDNSVSVQIPSRSSTTDSFEVRKLSEVRKRFLDQRATADPWNIQDLQSPLPQSILPNFLTGENCQLLLQARNTALMEGSAERVVASTQEWNEWKNVLEWILLSEGGNNTAPHTDSHGFATWITAQEESIGFGWMSCPTKEEREEWMADPHRFTGGRWRYVVLKPGQSFYFKPGTIHFVFRVQGLAQTLALGGHTLQWTGIERWMQVLLAQMKNPAITNEDMNWSAPKLVRIIAKLVTARVEEGEVEELGGEATVMRFFASVKPHPKTKAEVASVGGDLE